MSAVALVGFAACTEGLNDEGIRVEVNKEEVSIFASFDEDDTRMTLNDKTPVWEKGDVITINGFEFTAQESGTSVQFKGEVDASLIGAPFTAYYGGETVADEQVAREGDMPKNTPAMAEGDAFESGMTIEFFNIAALLKFKPTFAGDITFDILDGEAITITGCEANKEYYVAVTPATWEEGVKVKRCALTVKQGAVGQEIERNKIYNLGTISMPAAHAKWGMAGDFNGWAAGTPEPMYDTGRWLFACNISKLNGGFKFVFNKSWDVSYGGTAKTANSLNNCSVSNSNLSAPNANGYDVYYGPATMRYFITPHGTAKDWGAIDPNKLYFKPCAKWNESSPRYAAYFYGNGEKWVSMTKSANGDFYEVAKQSGYPNVIFCRMNPSASANNWTNKWNQTADLTVPTDGNNLYTYPEITGSAWDKLSGTWSKVE